MKPAHKDFLQSISTRDTFPYRGFLVRYNPISRCWWVEKDGFHIATPMSYADAIATIDTLLD